MAKHILAIDETGRFSMKSDDKSFVCGVVVSKDFSEIKKAYQKTYSDFGFPEPVPEDIKELLTNDTAENGDKARYHFNKLDDTQKAFCKYNLMPLVDEIIKSEGKPALFSNNQNWWLVAVTSVVRQFLKSREFKDNDEIEVFIDGRKDEVWGMVYEKGETLDDLSDNDRRDRYYKYHNNKIILTSNGNKKIFRINFILYVYLF